MHNNLKEHLERSISDTSKNMLLEADDKSKKVSSFWGKIGGFANKFFGVNSDTEADPISKALAEQEKMAEDSAKEREKKLLQSKEGAIVAKLKAKFAAKQNALELANQRRIAAWDEQKRKAEAAKKYWEKNKTQRSAADMQAWYDQIDNDYQGLQDTEGISEAQEYKDLITVIAFNEDGSLRSADDIIKAMTEPNTELGKKLGPQIKRLKELSNEHGDQILEGLDNDEFVKFLEKNRMQATAMTTANDDLKARKKELEEMEKKRAAVGKIADLNANHTKAEDEKKAADEAKAKFSKDPYEMPTDGNGGGTPTVNNLQNYISTVIDNAPKNNGEPDPAKIREALKAAGIPEDAIGDTEEIPTAQNIASAIDGKSDDDKNAIMDSINAQVAKNYSQVEKKVKEANEKVEKTKFPVKGTGPNAADEYKAAIEKYCADNGITGTAQDEILDMAKTYSEIAPKDIENREFDADNEASEYNKCKEAVKEAEENKAKLEAEQRSRKERIAMSVANINHKRDMENIDDDTKQKIEDKVSAMQPGEAMENGQVGYYDKDGKFKPKPPVGNAEEDAKYNAGLKMSIITTNKADGGKTLEEVKIGKDKDGNTMYYKEKKDANGNVIKNSDGEVEKIEATADEYAEYKANQRITVETKNKKGAERNKFAKTLAGVVEDGKINKEKFKNLPPEQQEMFKYISSMDENEVKDLFGGLELGEESLTNIQKAIQADEWDHLDEWTDEENELNTDEEGGDIDTGEKEIVATDDAGNKYVKVGDNWYDADDIDDDGKPKADTKAITDATKISELGDGEEQSRMLENPKKVWKRKKKANGKGRTTNYYKKNKKGKWISITPEELDKKMEAYKKAKAKKSGGGGEPLPGGGESCQFNDFKHMLLESVENSIAHNIMMYNKLKQYLIDNIN